MVGDNRLVASHYDFVYAVLSVANSYLWFDIVAEESINGTDVSLVMQYQGSVGLTVTHRDTFKYDMRHSGIVPTQFGDVWPAGVDDYEAFHGMLGCFVYGQGWYDFNLPTDQRKDSPRVLTQMEGMEEKPPENCKLDV